MTASSIALRPSLRGLPLYALVDPYLGDYPEHGIDLSQCTTFDSLCAIRTEAWQGRTVFLAEGDDPVAEAHRLPYAVDFSDADDKTVDALTAAATEEHERALTGEMAVYRIGTLIETWMRPADLLQRLEAMWHYRPNLHNFRYLRIGDRRIFEALVHLFEPAAIARWLGPIARWHILGLDQRWHTIAGEADVDGGWYSDSGLGMRRTVDPSRALESASLAAGTQQHWRLYDMEAVSRALLEWQGCGRAIDADAYQKAWAGAREASQHGLKEAEDKAAFAFCWMRDPTCGTRLPVSQALQLSQDGERSFAEVLSEMELEVDHPHGLQPVN